MALGINQLMNNQYGTYDDQQSAFDREMGRLQAHALRGMSNPNTVTTRPDPVKPSHLNTKLLLTRKGR